MTGGESKRNEVMIVRQQSRTNTRRNYEGVRSFIDSLPISP